MVEEALKRALDLSPDDENTRFVLGHVLFVQGCLTPAIKHYELVFGRNLDEVSDKLRYLFNND